MSSPAIANGVVYVGSGNGNIYALNALTGEYLWNYLTGGDVESSPAVADGVVYVGSNDGNIYALDATTGVLIWSYATGSSAFSSPAVAGGAVFVGGGDNYIHAFGMPPSSWTLKSTQLMTVPYQPLGTAYILMVNL